MKTPGQISVKINIIAPGHSRTCCPVLQRSDGALMNKNTGIFVGSAVADM
jgi:hypothetical protein